MTIVPIVVPVLFTFVIVIGFIGNLLVVLVVLLNKTMRNTTNILIFNLAVRYIHLSMAFCTKSICLSKIGPSKTFPRKYIVSLYVIQLSFWLSSRPYNKHLSGKWKSRDEHI